jgi:hypothetical protein
MKVVQVRFLHLSSPLQGIKVPEPGGPVLPDCSKRSQMTSFQLQLSATGEPSTLSGLLPSPGAVYAYWRSQFRSNCTFWWNGESFNRPCGHIAEIGMALPWPLPAIPVFSLDS